MQHLAHCSSTKAIMQQEVSPAFGQACIPCVSLCLLMYTSLFNMAWLPQVCGLPLLAQYATAAVLNYVTHKSKLLYHSTAVCCHQCSNQLALWDNGELLFAGHLSTCSALMMTCGCDNIGWWGILWLDTHCVPHDVQEGGGQLQIRSVLSAYTGSVECVGKYKSC